MKNQRPVTRSAPAFWSASQPRRSRENLAFVLAVSLYFHALILSLQFGVAGFGLPGLAFPWTERRGQASELTVRLVDAPRQPAPAAASPPVLLAVPPRAPTTTLTAKRPQRETPSRADGSFEAQVSRAKPSARLTVPPRETRPPVPTAKARARDRKIRPKPRPQILAQRDPQQETFNVPPPKRAEPEAQRAPESTAKKHTEEATAAVQATEQASPRQAEEAARLEAEEAARQRAEEDARQRALALQKEFESKKQEEARRLENAKKQEEAGRQALALEARRLAEKTTREAEELARRRALALQKEQEAKRLQDASRIEETRIQEEARNQEEMKKQEEATRITLEAEALRRAEDAARQQAAARQKELEARRQAEEAAARAKESAERQRAEAEAAAQRERERLAAQQAPAPAPGALSGKELAAKALDQLRTPGAARDDLLRPPSRPASAENPRRRSLFGVERDVGLRMYVDSWRWKIERSGAVNYRPSAAWRAHENPIVTVSIRKDGSVEDVLIHRSSGVRELDEAVRRIARLHAPYSAFPPELARQYDVIEIRRVWSFESTLRILDEM